MISIYKMTRCYESIDILVNVKIELTINIYINPQIIHVCVQNSDLRFLTFHIWYCALKNGIGQKKLHWPNYCSMSKL